MAPASRKTKSLSRRNRKAPGGAHKTNMKHNLKNCACFCVRWARILCLILIVALLAIIPFFYNLTEFGMRDKVTSWKKMPLRNKKDTALEHRGYLVNSGKCKTMERDPYDRSISHLLRVIPQTIRCNTKPPLTYVLRTRNAIEPTFALHLNETLASELRGPVSCCYMPVTRLNLLPGQDYDMNVDNRYRLLMDMVEIVLQNNIDKHENNLLSYSYQPKWLQQVLHFRKMCVSF